MNQLETLIQNAKKRNFAVHFYHHELNAIDCEIFTGVVGIENKNNLVYWFQYSKEGNLSFQHVYNCNSGKTTKGFTQGYNFLLNLLNK